SAMTASSGFNQQGDDLERAELEPDAVAGELERLALAVLHKVDGADRLHRDAEAYGGVRADVGVLEDAHDDGVGFFRLLDRLDGDVGLVDLREAEAGEVG